MGKNIQGKLCQEVFNRIKLVSVEHFTDIRRFLIEILENESLLDSSNLTSTMSGSHQQSSDQSTLPEGRSLIMIDHLSSLNSAYGTLDASECRPDYHSLGLLEMLGQQFTKPRVDFVIMDSPQMDIVFYRRFFGGMVCKMFRWLGSGGGRRRNVPQSEEYVIEVLRQNFETDNYNAQILFEVEEDRGICVKVIDFRDVKEDELCAR